MGEHLSVQHHYRPPSRHGFAACCEAVLGALVLGVTALLSTANPVESRLPRRQHQLTVDVDPAAPDLTRSVSSSRISPGG